MATDKEALEKELAEHREKRKEVLAKRAAREEKANTPIKKKLVIERYPTGLYFVQFKEGGALPTELQGTFTSISKLRETIRLKYGEDILE